jgi:hypothetical protein
MLHHVLSHSLRYGDKNIGKVVYFASKANKMTGMEISEMEDEWKEAVKVHELRIKE